MFFVEINCLVATYLGKFYQHFYFSFKTGLFGEQSRLCEAGGQCWR